MKRRSIKQFRLTAMIGLASLVGVILSGQAFSAQPGKLNQQTYKETVKSQYANLALPMSSAVRQGKIMIVWKPRSDASGYYIYRDGIKINNNKPVVKKTAGNITDCLKAGSPEMREIAKILQINPNFPSQFWSPNIVENGKILINRDELRKIAWQLYPGAARAMGAGYLDETSLVNGRTYIYKVNPIIGGQESLVFGGSITVVHRDSSNDMKLPGANQCMIYEGDQSVELLWPKTSNILAYDIYRSTVANPSQEEKLNLFANAMTKDFPGNAPTGVVENPLIKVRPIIRPVPSGPFKITDAVNNSPKTQLLLGNSKTMAFFVDSIIISNPVPSPGPSPKPVQIQVIHAVNNKTAYRYRIVPRDILGPASNPNQYLALQATPRDRLKPGIPDPLKFEVIHRQWTVPAMNSQPGCCASTACPLCFPNWLFPKPGTKYDQINGGLRLSWSPVTLNVEGNPEKVASYKLWRYNSETDAAQNDDPAKRTLIGTCPVNNQTILAMSDLTAKSETMYWYRVEVSDTANLSSFSGIFTASYPDNLAPLAPANVKVLIPKNESESLTGITIQWDAVKDADNPSTSAADVSGYRIYRRVCGTRPFAKRNTSMWVSGGTMPTEDEVKNGTYKDFFVPIYTVPANPNTTTYSYTDKSLPVDSPYSWEYCVKAVDKSQNVSLNTISNVTCGRLTKQKGPRAATITSLQARGNSIRIDWAAPPSVDLFTFRVYRSEQPDHKDWQPVTYDPEFTELHCWDTPLTPPDFCAGLTPDPHKYPGKPAIQKGMVANTYYFIDNKNIKPNQKYWYKIVSYDYLKNPKDDSLYTKESTSVMMSTFTYEKYIKDGMTIQAPFYNPVKGVTLTWTPPSGISGNTYQVFRSNKSSGDGFMPLAAALTGNNYTDPTARPGVTYWYKVQYVTASGHYSEFSNVVALKVPE